MYKCYTTFCFSPSFREVSGKSFHHDLSDNLKYNFSEELTNTL